MTKEKHVETIKRNRIAIYYPREVFDTVPSLYNAALLLAQHGYFVDIYIHSTKEYKLPNFNTDKICLKIINQEKHSSIAIDKLTGKITNDPSTNGLARVFRIYNNVTRNIKNTFDKFISIRQLRSEIKSTNRVNPYLCFIGVDPNGLIETSYLVKGLNIHVLYYSLELLISSEIHNKSEKQLKNKEIALSQKAKYIIIQDVERAGILAEENHINKDKIISVPNSPIGKAKREISDYWHKKFELPQDKKIVLYAGSLGNWTGIDKIITSVEKWPDNWILVVHTRFDSTMSPEVKRLQSLAIPNKVFFSLNPVSNEEYERLLNSADIGIAFYVEDTGSTCTQKNIQSIGFSSGKIAYYLHCGLPVIVNDFSSIGEKLKLERCGIAVKDESEIKTAICQIEQNYMEYSRNACRFFDQYLEYENNFKTVLDKLNSLM